MNDYDRWRHDIQLIFDNDYNTYITLQELAGMAQTPADLGKMLQDFYEQAIDSVLRETPENTIGHMLVREMCMYIPLSVFDRIADDVWEANNWGNCGKWECRKRYDRASSDDHCANCDCCNECCECSHE